MTKIDMELYKEIGKILKRKRNEANLSLDQLVVKLGGVKTKSTLKRYEDGVSRLDVDTLKLICNTLQIDYVTVVNEAEEKTKFIYPDTSHFGDHQANLKYFANKPDLLTLYNDLVENDNLRILFDSAKDLEPRDLEPVLILIKGIRKEKGLE